MIELRITELAHGKKIEVALTNSVLTIGSLTIDLQERQQDVQQMIDICLSDGNLHEGMGDYYVAVVTIPPRQYASNDDCEQIIMPLSESEVAIALWPLPKNYKAETETNEEEVE